MIYPRLVIAGTHSGVGKTTVTLALLAALKARGRRVQPFKAGPDFIDPGHHALAAGRVARNLDTWMLAAEANRHILTSAAADAELSIIEGMMGLYDGSTAVDETGSTAELAQQLAAPVLLVLDASAMARSAAAMAWGYANFASAVPVKGVLLNRVGSDGHYRLLKKAIEAETNLIVAGYLKPNPSFSIPDRHLGLITAHEQGTTDLYDRLANAARETIDLDQVDALARSAGPLPMESLSSVAAHRERIARIGVAQDAAFCFYYPDNLELLEAEGAELVRFSPLTDQVLPKVDMLYLGGGYPELHAEALTANVPMRQAIRSFAERGGPIYAECGGLMYLTQTIRQFDGTPHEMVGLFPAAAVMRKPGLTLGYRTLRLASPCILGVSGLTVRGHEFHYSALEPNGELHYACTLADAQGNPKGQDGLMVRNTLALYTHLHFASQPHVARALVAAAHRTAARVSSHCGGVP
ncbi:MAG TPA: cobyrinate a,c-diamide synthase [Nitrospira sp.]|nr:cobyrinate a,c-diamide synthase [Nitrospira sp.]